MVIINQRSLINPSPVRASCGNELSLRVPRNALHEPLVVSQDSAVAAAADVPQEQFVVDGARRQLQ